VLRKKILTLAGPEIGIFFEQRRLQPGKEFRNRDSNPFLAGPRRCFRELRGKGLRVTEPAETIGIVVWRLSLGSTKQSTENRWSAPELQAQRNPPNMQATRNTSNTGPSGMP
jgi:hypothetical protein